MIWHKETQQTMLDLGNHAPQKHEEMGGFLTENGMKILAEGCFFLGKMHASDGVAPWSVCPLLMTEFLTSSSKPQTELLQLHYQIEICDKGCQGQVFLI